jgi:hypothetical protein
MIGDRPMTGAERIAKWRRRHAAKLARKAARRGGHTAPTPEEWAALMPTMEDWNRWLLAAPDEWKP